MIAEITGLEIRANKRGTEYLYDPLTESVVAKRCSRCSEMKLLDHYQNSKSYFCGKRNFCRTCAHEYEKKRYQETKDTLEPLKREHKRKTRYAKKYYYKNREKLIEQAKERHKTPEYKERKKEYDRRYIEKKKLMKIN